LHAGVKDIHAEARAEYVAASGLYEQEFYEAAGVERGKAVITGNPAWDYLYLEGGLPERAEARRVLCLPADGRVICYATTWGQTTSMRSRFGDEFKEGLLAVIEYAKSTNSILIVKVHPNQNPAEGEQIAALMGQMGARGLVSREHLTYCLRASDLLIAQSPSNLCIEAATLGVPSVYIQTEGFDYKHSLPHRCGVAGLAAACGAAMATNPDAWQDFITYYNAAHPDGGATDRVVEMVGRLCPTI
jgi:CDP-glycerol glycerophosphotransferase (TagB/SpsB family)